MLKIGVTPCMFYEDDKRTSFAPKYLNYICQDMARFLYRDNVLPILIPSLESLNLKAFVQEMDGIVFHGGEDVAPESYHESPIGKWKGDPKRDVIELKIMQYAMELNKPILGICRGFHIMNVYFGGSLYQDIPSQFPSETLHKGTDYDQNIHSIRLKQGSVLSQLNQLNNAGLVNSIHHQGIKTLGEGLEAIAWDSQDDLIEAFYLKNQTEGRVMGVQWHPEFHWNHTGKLLSAEKLYDQFLHFCKK